MKLNHLEQVTNLYNNLFIISQLKKILNLLRKKNKLGELPKLETVPRHVVETIGFNDDSSNCDRSSIVLLYIDGSEKIIKQKNVR